MGRFGHSLRTARMKLEEFMSDLKMAKREAGLFKGGGLVRSASGMKQLQKTTKDDRQCFDERILGNGQFVETMLQQVELQDHSIQSGDPKRAAQFEALQEEICKRQEVVIAR